MENTTQPYTIVPTTPFQVFVKPHCNKWNLAQPDYLGVLSNPITTSADNGYSFTVNARLLRTDPELSSHVYYLEEANTPHGWDAADCVVENVGVVNASPKPPTGALPVPVNTSEYHLIVAVPTYRHRTSSESSEVAEPGDYVCFKEANGRFQLAKDRDSIRFWIDPEDNVLPAVEEPLSPEDEAAAFRKAEKERMVANRGSHVGNLADTEEAQDTQPTADTPTLEALQEDIDRYWKASYKPFPLVRTYRVNMTGTIQNLDELGEPVQVDIHKGEHVNVYGTVFRDNEKWYRLKIKRDTNFDLWLCVPQTRDEKAVLTLPSPSWADHIFHGWQKTKKEAQSIFPVNLKNEKYLDIAQPKFFEKPKKYRGDR